MSLHQKFDGNGLGIYHIEVTLASSLPASQQLDLKSWLESRIKSIKDKFILGKNGDIDLSFLSSKEHCVPGVDQIVKARVTPDDDDVWCTSADSFSSDCPFVVHMFELNREDSSIEEIEPSGGGDEWTACCDSLELPHASLEGLWENLIYGPNIKLQLLNQAESAILFGDKKVSTNIVHLNRIFLLHGVPGTGKTSLCRALAHKLAIRLSDRFQRASLLEIHSHSLFSKWFSTSGKLISALFSMVRDMVEDDPHSLVCVLIDEVESLASSRSGGNDHSDAMRAVNSLLTSLDRLRSFPNVLILATTNITDQIDTAFVDRVDLKVQIGLPILRARFEILRTCLLELVRVGIIEGLQPNERETVFVEFDSLVKGKDGQMIDTDSNDNDEESTMLLKCAQQAEGLSGRSIRRLPLQAHSLVVSRIRLDGKASMNLFLQALMHAIGKEQESRSNIS